MKIRSRRTRRAFGAGLISVLAMFAGLVGASAVRGFALVLIVLNLAACGALQVVADQPMSGVRPEAERALNYSTVSTANLGYEPQVMAVSPKGDLVAVSGKEPFIDVLDTATGTRKVRLVGHRLPLIGALVFSADGRVLVSGGGVPERGTPEPSIRFWNIATGEMTETIPEAQTAEIVSLAISDDAKRLFTVGTDSLKMWSLPGAKSAVGMWVDHTLLICGMAASRDMRFVATGGNDHRVLVRSTSNMNRFEALHGHADSPCGLRFNPENASLVSWDFGSTMSTIRVWDLVRFAPMHRVDVRGRILTVFFVGGKPVAAIAGTIVTGGRSAEGPGISDKVSFISIDGERLLGELPVSPKLFVATPEGQSVVAATWDGTVQVFRLGGAQ